MQQLISGLGKQSASYGGDYWNAKAEQRDRERKALRAGTIPIPASVLAANNQVDAQTRANLLVDWLADKDNFHHMTLNTPGFARMSPEQQIREIEGLMEEVKAAPPNQQESARRSLVNELKGVGGLIGRSLKTGWDAISVDTPLDPFLDPAMDWSKGKFMEVVERGMQETAGTALGVIQKFIPGTQDFEASIEAERKMAGLPWWRKYTGMYKAGWTDPLATSRVIREEGWQVPWYAHVPLEVALDPWNIAFGIGFIPDILRGVKLLGPDLGGKWIRSGKDLFGPKYVWHDTDLQPGLLWGKAGKIITKEQTAARLAARESARLAQDMAKLNEGRQQEMWELFTDNVMEDEFGEAAEHLDPKTGKKFTGWLGPEGQAFHSYGEGLPAGGTLGRFEAATKSTEGMAADLDNLTGGKFRDTVDAQDAFNMSEIRDAPWREALWDVITNKDIPVEAMWALKMLYYTGLRPNELQYITTGSIDRALEMADIPTLFVTVGTQSSPRRLTDEAVEFLKEFKARQKELQPRDLPEPTGLEAAFSMPEGVTLNATSINKYFREAAERSGDHGKDLLRFYEKNANYAYVFRLSFANNLYMTTPGIRQTMLGLGHRSHFHTARYVSSTFYNVQTVEELFRGTSNIGRRGSKIPPQSFFPAEIIDEVEANLAKKSIEEGWKPLSVFGIHNRPPATQKGFLAFEEQRNAVLQARLQLMRSIVAPEVRNNGEHMVFGIPPQVAPATATLAQNLQELGTFATFISDMIIEKGLLKTSKELVDVTKGADVGLGVRVGAGAEPVKTTIKEQRDAAKLAFSALEEWVEPILDMSTIWAKEIALDPVAGDHMADLLLAPFQQLGFSQLNKMAIQKKGGQYGGRGGQRMNPLAAIFAPFYVAKTTEMGSAQERLTALLAKKKRTKKEQLEMEILEEWQGMTLGQQQKMEKNDFPLNYIIKQSGRKGLKTVDGVKETASKSLWLVTEWLHAPVEGQAEKFATVMNFMNTPKLVPTAEDMIMYGTRAARKAMIVVHVDGHGPQAFYRAVGEEDIPDGTWLPFDGIHVSDEFVSESGVGGKGTFDTTAFNLPDNEDFVHYGNDLVKKMSEKLTKMDLPWKDARRVTNLEEINSWANTGESLKRNRPFDDWTYNNQGDAVPKAGLPIVIQTKQLGEITGAKITKLADQAVQGGKIVRARQVGEDLEREITRVDMEYWNQWFSGPVPEAVIRNAFPGGPRRLNPEIMAAMAMAAGLKLANMQIAGMTKKQLRARLKVGGKKAPSRERLFGRPGKPTGLLEEIPGAPGQWRFTEDVMEEIRKITDTDNPEMSEGWAWAVDIDEPLQVAGAGGRGPGRRKPPGSVDDFDEPWGVGKDKPADWHTIKIKDERGIMRTLGEILVNPRGMWQPGMQFSGGKVAKAFFEGLQTWKPLGVEIGGLNKVIRMGVPGTFGASEAAKIRWKYMFSKKQGQLISSDIGHILGEFHTITGMGNDGICLNLKVLGKVNRFGQAIDDVVGSPTYGEVLPKDAPGIRSHPANKIMELEFDDLRVEDEVKAIWTDSRINSIRAGWSHQKNLQDASTFLQTPREDLHLYYDVNHTWKARGMGPTHIAGDNMGWDDMLRMHDYYHQIDPQLWKMMDDAGMSMTDLLTGVTKIDPNFVPSLVTDKWAGSAIGVKVGTEIGTSPTQFMRRVYTWQIQGKIQAGKSRGRIQHDIYNADPILAMQRQVEAYYSYIADERFIDEYTKLGIPQSQRETAIGAGVAIRQALYPALDAEPKVLTEKVKKAAAHFYGPDWENLSKIDIDNRITQLREIDAAYTDLKLKKATEYIVQSKPLGTKHDVGTGWALPPDASRELLALGADEVNKISQFVSVPAMISNMMRLLATGADLGVMMLHGFGGLGVMLSPTGHLPETIRGRRTPWASLHIPWKQRKAWAQGATNMMHGLFSREVRRKWYESTAITRAEMQRYGVAFFRSTFIEDLPLPGIFTPAGSRTKFAKPGEKLVELGMKPIEGFGFFLDVSKTEMWKANQLGIEMSAGIKRGPTKLRRDEQGKMVETQGDIIEGDIKFYQEQMADFAASLNAIHGTLEPAVAGIQSKQRVFESAYLMYAALYRRSALALVKNMVSGVPAAIGKAATGDLAGAAHEIQRRKWRRGPALQAISGMMMAGGMIGSAIKLTGNNEDVFDISSADFMSVHAGGIRIGLGTAYYSLMRMGHDIVEQLQDDPGGLKEVSFSENSVMRWARSQSSPTTSLGIDVVTGADFIGSPLRDTNGGWEVNEIGSRSLRTMMPFWLESSFHADNKEDASYGSLSEFFGLRVSPISPWGKLQAAREAAILLDNDPDLLAWRREQDRLGLPINGNTVPVLYLRRLIERTPYLKDLEEQVSEDTQARGSKARRDQDDFIRLINDNKKDADEKLKGIAKNFENNLLSGQDFRKEIEKIEIELRGKNLQLGASYEEVIAKFDERRTGRLDNPADIFVMDIAYDMYRAMVTNNPEIHDAFGNFDVDKFKAQEASFRKDNRINTQTWEYIQARRKEGRNLPQAVKDLNAARDPKTGLHEYWNLHETVFGPKSYAARLINEHRKMPTQQAKDMFEMQNPVVTRLLKTLSKAKTLYRMQHLDKDRMLVRFYDYSPVHPGSARDIVSARRNIPVPTLAV